MEPASELKPAKSDEEFCKTVNLEPLEYLVYDVIEQGAFPHYLKLFPKNSYIRRAIHIKMERLHVECVTDKENPFFFFHYQGWESFDIRDFISFPMILTITEKSIKPQLKKKVAKLVNVPTEKENDGAFPVADSEGFVADWSGLPDFVLYCIFSQLPWNDINSCFQTCALWNAMSASPLLWQTKWALIVEEHEKKKAGKWKKEMSSGKLALTLNSGVPRGPLTNIAYSDDGVEILDYKSMVKNELLMKSNSCCGCQPIRHKHYSSAPSPDPCYISCHAGLLSSLRHAIQLFRSWGYKGELVYNPHALRSRYFV